MPEWYFESARVLARRIRKRELSSSELIEAFLARIERVNPAINAVVTLDASRARMEARQADEMLARGESVGPLHGVPMTLKDSFEVAGMRTTAGTKIWKDHVSTLDAVIVQRLRAAGAIIAGKTNTPPFCADWQSANEIFGITNNPWDLKRTPGGSSGGAAAALASGMTPIEMGSDIAGSIRLPSSFCGVFGHKPTHDVVPARGHIPGPSGTLAIPDLVVVGPMARSADDLALLLDLVAGPLPEKGKAYSLHLPPPRAATLRGYRVAAWFEDAAFPVDASVLERLHAAVDALRKAGVTVDDAHPSTSLHDIHDVYRRLIDPMMIAGAPPHLLERLMATAAGPDAADADTYFARNALARHDQWLVANELRWRLRASVERFFEDYDVLLCPVTPTPAFPHDATHSQSKRRLTVNGQPRPYLDMMGWVSLATTAYLPATVAPIGRTAEGLPVGVQIIGPYLEDRTSIDFAARLGELLGGFEPPPGH